MKPIVKPKKPPVQKRIERKMAVRASPVMDPSFFPAYPADDHRPRLALVQPGSWGDNINSTLMFKPLRAKFPEAHLDVYTSTIFGSAFLNNPYITHLIQLPATTKQEALHQLVTTPPLLAGRGYLHIFVPHPMVNPGNWTSIKSPLGTNLICSFVRALEHADVPYELPLETILRLTPAETAAVDRFCQGIDMTARNVLMEVQGESGQTFWNHTWTTAVGRHLLTGNTNLFISRRHNAEDILELQQHAPGRVFFVGNLSIRECAELFNRCQIFFSVSSGLSNACNTNWCRKDVRWIETINSEVVTSAPIRRDGKVFWMNQNLPTFLDMLRSQGI